MTLFRFITHKREGENGNCWDGMKPPRVTLTSIYYDFKWNYKLYQVDGLPFTKRIVFGFIKILQIISYNKGWYSGRKL